MIMLPSGGGGSRLRLVTGPLLRALQEAPLAQLWASLLEVLRATEGQPATLSRLLEQLGAATGAVGGIGALSMLL